MYKVKVCMCKVSTSIQFTMSNVVHTCMHVHTVVVCMWIQNLTVHVCTCRSTIVQGRKNMYQYILFEIKYIHTCNNCKRSQERYICMYVHYSCTYVRATLDIVPMQPNRNVMETPVTNILRVDANVCLFSYM